MTFLLTTEYRLLQWFGENWGKERGRVGKPPCGQKS